MVFGRLARGLAVLLVTAVLASCTSSDTTASTSGGSVSPGASGSSLSTLSPTDYIDTLCASTIAWINTIKLLSAKLAFEVARTAKSDTAKLQKFLVSYLAGAADQTEPLILAAQSIGAPNVDNGAAAQAQLVDAYTKVRDAFSTAEQNIKALTAADSAAIKDAIKNAAQQLKTETEDIGSAMSGLASQEMKDAYKSDAACSPIRKA